VKINLLPPKMRRMAGRANRLRYAVVIGLVIVLMPVYFTYRLGVTVERLAQNELTLKNRVGLLTPFDALLTERAELEKRVAELKQAGGERIHFVPTIHLDELLRLLPPSTFLSSIALDKGSLRFNGVVGSLTEAATLLKLIQTSPLYDSPLLSQLSSEPRGYRFEISATLLGGERK